MLRALLLAMLGASLSGCDRAAEFEAFTFCAEKLEEQFPETKTMSDDEIGQDLAGAWNTDSAGNFNFVLPAADGSTLWSCNGNWKSRRIDQVSYKSTVKQPPNSVIWSF